MSWKTTTQKNQNTHNNEYIIISTMKNIQMKMRLQQSAKKQKLPRRQTNKFSSIIRNSDSLWMSFFLHRQSFAWEKMGLGISFSVYNYSRFASDMLTRRSWGVKWRLTSRLWYITMGVVRPHKIELKLR